MIFLCSLCIWCSYVSKEKVSVANLNVVSILYFVIMMLGDGNHIAIIVRFAFGHCAIGVVEELIHFVAMNIFNALVVPVVNNF